MMIFIVNGVRIIQAGGEESQRGVALIMDKRTANMVDKVVNESDQLLMVSRYKMG